MNKPSILLFIEYYLPGHKSGGPVQSIANLILILQPHYTLYVVTRDRDYKDPVPYQAITANEWLDRDTYKIMYRSPEKLTPWSTYKLVKSGTFDFIYTNSLFGQFTHDLLLIGLLTRRRIIIAPRGELHEGALQLKAYKKHPFVYLLSFLPDGFITWHATDQKEVNCVEKLFPKSLIGLVPVVFAPDTPRQFVQRVGYTKKAGSARLVFISRITPKKGLRFLAEVFQKLEGKAVELTIYGPIEDLAYWHSCCQLFGALSSSFNIVYKGTLHHSLVNGSLAMHDFFVLPTLGENFGHAIFEAFSVGLPVLTSDQTQWRGLTHKQAGWDVPLDHQQWVSALHHMIDMDNDTYTKFTKGARSLSEWYLTSENFEEKYISLFS